jgi:hypothetical protein
MKGWKSRFFLTVLSHKKATRVLRGKLFLMYSTGD